MIIDLLNRFEPDLEGLLRAISSHIDDEMLEWISAADYAQDADLHLAALRLARDKGIFVEPMHWYPMEVLELIRWSEPDDPEWRPGGTEEFGHWMRAFSCAAILRVEHDPYKYGYNEGSTSSTVIQLILSLRALPVDFNSQAAKHFAWLLLHSDPEGMNDQVPIYGVALLWFALQTVPGHPDQTLISLARWVIRRADEVQWWPSAGGWSGLREMVFSSQKRSAWELFGCYLSDLDLSDRSSDLQILTKLIGEQLAG